MKVGSLFSGIGGLDLGLERAGMQVLWQCEPDKYCRRILALHWPNTHCYNDIRDIGADAPAVDLLCGGFPCQPVSLAGKRLAQKDERWLWPEFARCIRLLRPRLVLLENVPGLLVRGFGDVLRDLAKSGYDAEWDCIPAAAFGAPFRGTRTFLVATPTGERLERWIFSKGAWKTQPEPSQCDWWESEPRLARVAHGVPHRVDRLRALGNSVVPQVAEWIGHRIMETYDG